MKAKQAAGPDRAMLDDLVSQARQIAGRVRPCAGQSCTKIALAGFASGLLAELPAGRLHGRDWAADVFSPAQYPYRDSVWAGPLIILVDDETWSAAEQFTALLRDNDAAIVMGARTGGAGCGHLYGNDPVILSNSKARLELPNCARFRKDGSNEVNGIVPDVPTGVRWNDGSAFAARLTADRLPDAVRQARTLVRRQKR